MRIKNFVFRTIFQCVRNYMHSRRFIFSHVDDDEQKRDYPSVCGGRRDDFDLKCIHICMYTNCVRCNFNEFIIAFGNGKVIFHRCFAPV